MCTPASTTVTGRGLSSANPASKRAISSSGRCVADRPMRCKGRAPEGRRASRRSRVRARWLPRLLAAMAWISSTITVSTAPKNHRAREVSSRYSDSGVVIRMSGGWRNMRARSLRAVSPVRISMRGTVTDTPVAAAASQIPATGARRFRSTSTARALSGETYTTRQRLSSAGSGDHIILSRAERKAASVLPEPVGARSSVDFPARMGFQPNSCAAVGCPSARPNQSRTGG